MAVVRLYGSKQDVRMQIQKVQSLTHSEVRYIIFVHCLMISDQSKGNDRTKALKLQMH